MKTIKSIEQEIQEQINESERLKQLSKESINNDRYFKSALRKVSGRISYLRRIKQYLDTNPTQACLDRQITQLKKKIKVVDDEVNRIQANNSNHELVKIKIRDLKSKEGYSRMNSQLKNLLFIND